MLHLYDIVHSHICPTKKYGTVLIPSKYDYMPAGNINCHMLEYSDSTDQVITILNVNFSDSLSHEGSEKDIMLPTQWELDVLGIKEKPKGYSDVEVMKNVCDTIQYDSIHKQYIVHLPWKSFPPEGL